MLAIALRIIPILIFWSVLAALVLLIPYPTSLTEASLLQLAAFFIPLFLALIFTLNLFLNFLLYSVLISSAVIFLLLLKAMGALNLVSAALTILTIYLLLSYFKRSGKKKISLTSPKNIPKLKNLSGRKRGQK